MKKPNVEMPTLVEGRIDGPIRLESLDGDELWLPEQTGIIRDLKPLEHKGKMFAITHIQKKSFKGNLLLSPFCIHWWDMSKLQEYTEEPDGSLTWKSGTEKGWVFRSPGWRFDFAGTKGEHWILTGGHFGRKYD